MSGSGQSREIDGLFADLLDQQSTSGKGLPPVDKWNPPLSGALDIRIARSGEWFHEGDLIRREALVKLFSGILKREGDNYFLVSPVEKWQIQVEDVPFHVVGVESVLRDGQQALLFHTATGDQVVAGAGHPIRVDVNPVSGEPSPYLLIRNNMEGLISRPVFYQLAQLATVAENKEKAVHGVYSLGCFFALE